MYIDAIEKNVDIAGGVLMGEAHWYPADYSLWFFWKKLCDH